MIRRTILSPSGLQEVLVLMAPLLMLAASLIVCFRAGLWNLGIDGQYLLGGLFVAAYRPRLGGGDAVRARHGPAVRPGDRRRRAVGDGAGPAARLRGRERDHLDPDDDVSRALDRGFPGQDRVRRSGKPGAADRSAAGRGSPAADRRHADPYRRHHRARDRPCRALRDDAHVLRPQAPDRRAQSACGRALRAQRVRA